MTDQSNGDEKAMRRQDLEAMDFEELWLLHEELTKILAEKITAEKRELEKRLSQLNQPDQFSDAESGTAETGTGKTPPRRKYPKVLPKYCNPFQPTETGQDVVNSLVGWLPPSNPATRSKSSKSSRTASPLIGMSVVRSIPSPAIAAGALPPV